MKVAFYKSKKHLFNRLIAWWTNGPYSHCELIVRLEGKDGYVCYSSSIADGGVRGKVINFPPDTWDLVDVDYDAETAENWFLDRLGLGYDYLGLVGFIFSDVPNEKNRYFCSEAVASSIGLENPSKIDPNTLYRLLTEKNNGNKQ